MDQEIMAVNTSAVRNAVNEIETALKKSKTDIQDVKEQLNNDEIWKAVSKTSLFNGYQKLNDFPEKEINPVLDKIKTVCGYIDDYKDKVKEINGLKKDLESASDDEKKSIEDDIRIADGDRQKIENDIRGLCGK